MHGAVRRQNSPGPPTGADQYSESRKHHQAPELLVRTDVVGEKVCTEFSPAFELLKKQNIYDFTYGSLSSGDNVPYENV